MKAPGGLDHGGDHHGAGLGNAIEGGVLGGGIEGGGGNAGQKLKGPASREHLFALSMLLLMYCFSLFTSFTVNLLVHLFTEYWICQVG